ncbi:Flotillin-like protein 1 [Camellia lanceoleosa]|uniref:Flotillin-like protein 1 n=1 Tax=Camellia lanceoleosa TaxID=1840588 RepID=A0ACC0HAV4_9ERIC|nr:Flotillin-like protein 1 [Camellia lanceoleosa]
MSTEKLPFILPAVFTIGLRVDCEENMLKYAKLISPHDMLSNHVTELVHGVIEGETRVLAASTTMEQIFKGTKEFKKEVLDKVQLKLDQFGLHIYNANVKQLDDVQEANSESDKKREKKRQILLTSKKSVEARSEPSTFYTCQQLASSTRRKKKPNASPPWQKPKAIT